MNKEKELEICNKIVETFKQFECKISNDIKHQVIIKYDSINDACLIVTPILFFNEDKIELLIHPSNSGKTIKHSNLSETECFEAITDALNRVRGQKDQYIVFIGDICSSINSKLAPSNSISWFINDLDLFIKKSSGENVVKIHPEFILDDFDFGLRIVKNGGIFTDYKFSSNIDAIADAILFFL